MSDNHTKPNVKARHGANLSLNDTNLSLGNRHGQATKHSLNSKVRFSVVTPVITHFFMKQAIATDDNSRYYSLTTKLLAVKPSRHSLAIFVPKTCLTTNQQATTGMNKNTSVFIQARHISSAVTGANIYDGLIEPNTTAFTVNKLNRLVTVVKTRHPIFMGDNKLTKLLGGHHNA